MVFDCPLIASQVLVNMTDRIDARLLSRYRSLPGPAVFSVLI